MLCPKCGGRLAHTHSFNAGKAAVTSRLECKVCFTVFTAVKVLVPEESTYGTGAYSLAKQIAGARVFSFDAIIGQKHPKKGQKALF